MTFDNDSWLRTLAADAYGRETGELMQALIQNRNDATPAYEALLIRVREVLVTRYSLDRVTQLLGHLNRPNRDTIIQMTRSNQ